MEFDERKAGITDLLCDIVAVELPDLPDETVVATFDDGVKMTMGEFKHLYAVLPPENQQQAMHEGLADHPRVTLHDYPGEDHGFAPLGAVLRIEVRARQEQHGEDAVHDVQQRGRALAGNEHSQAGESLHRGDPGHDEETRSEPAGQGRAAEVQVRAPDAEDDGERDQGARADLVHEQQGVRHAGDGATRCRK